eukprot:4443196-Pyramimonas_sp.AAC.1
MIHHQLLFLLVSVYGHATLGVKGANLVFLERRSELVPSAGCPFIIGGDWDIEVEDLRASQWPDHLGASILRPSDATSHGSCYDLFIASRCVDHYAVDCWAQLDTPVGPHSAVVLQLGRSLVRRRYGGEWCLPLFFFLAMKKRSSECGTRAPGMGNSCRWAS